jgi:hypothetical protein
MNLPDIDLEQSDSNKLSLDLIYYNILRQIFNKNIDKKKNTCVI